MITRGFMDVVPSKNELWWTHEPISALKEFVHPIDENTIDSSLTCSQALKKMKENSIDCLLVFENELILI